jgi:hypothetical protein
MTCCTTLAWYRGDSRTYRFTVLQKGTTIPVDITGWAIAAEVWDAASGEIRKATANITDGGDDQILITDATGGVFEVYILKDETLDFEDDAEIEVGEFTSGAKNTLYRVKIKFTDSELTWPVVP